jgi:hypothetical protein
MSKGDRSLRVDDNRKPWPNESRVVTITAAIQVLPVWVWVGVEVGVGVL